KVRVTLKLMLRVRRITGLANLVPSKFLIQDSIKRKHEEVYIWYVGYMFVHTSYLVAIANLFEDKFRVYPEKNVSGPQV
ncbi:765_t:CDS:2, partial [Rhizophagus irregularis]